MARHTNTALLPARSAPTCPALTPLLAALPPAQPYRHAAEGKFFQGKPRRRRRDVSPRHRQSQERTRAQRLPGQPALPAVRAHRAAAAGSAAGAPTARVRPGPPRPRRRFENGARRSNHFRPVTTATRHAPPEQPTAARARRLAPPLVARPAALAMGAGRKMGGEPAPP